MQYLYLAHMFRYIVMHIMCISTVYIYMYIYMYMYIYKYVCIHVHVAHKHADTHNTSESNVISWDSPAPTAQVPPGRRERSGERRVTR